MFNNPNKIITHTAVSSKSHTAEDVDDWHRARWNGYNPSPYYKNKRGVPFVVGYHFVIEWDGTVVQCRNIVEEGVHCTGQNFQSIGVCFMGNGDVHLPSEAQKNAWRGLFASINAKYPNITPTRCYPHRLYANKTCHGSLLSNDYWIKELGEKKTLSIPEMVEKIAQLRNMLEVLLKNKRMK